MLIASSSSHHIWPWGYQDLARSLLGFWLLSTSSKSCSLGEHPSCQAQKQSGNAGKSLPLIFYVLPCTPHSSLPLPCGHLSPFPNPSPNPGLSQSTLSALAGRAQPHCAGVRGQRSRDLLSGLQCSVRNIPTNRSLHKCTPPGVKTFLQGSGAPQVFSS